MAPKGNESPLSIRRPTLRRVVSKRSLAISRRLHVHRLGRKLKQARCQARSIFHRSSPPPPGIDYFSNALPVEIRLAILSYLLHFDAPLKLVPSHRRPARLKNLDILLVSRRIRVEALAVLYDLNTISVDRAVFCTSTKTPSRNALNHDLVRNLLISDLRPSIICAQLVDRSSWSTPPSLPCVYCDTCILPLIRSLRSMPRLRKVRIDYHGYAASIATLSTTLSRPRSPAPDLQLTCTGVGTYLLSGLLFPRTTLTLHDPLLAALWTRILALPPLMGLNLLAYYRNMRVGYSSLFAALAPRFGKKSVRDLARKLTSLVTLHDLGLIPREMKELWPADLEMELQAVQGCGRGGFLEGFNAELQRLCGEGVWFGD